MCGARPHGLGRVPRWSRAGGVHRDARRARVARALLATAERALAERGCPRVNLQVWPENGAALAFWRKVGYGDVEVVSLGKTLR